jgi:hypothetical protein
MRLGASANTSPAGFWRGGISAVLIINGNLSAADLNNLYIWARIRLGL